jgi:hypothetical protein
MNASMLSTSMARPGVFHRLLRVAVTLLVLHGAAATALIPVLGGWVLLYVVFPPFLPYIVWDGWTTAPHFATLAFGTALLPALAAKRVHAAVGARLPKSMRWSAGIVLALWIPLVCGESVRWALMNSALMQSDPRCHGTRSLVASIRQRYTHGYDESREPHAWVIRGGQGWLWSYRSLRFEPASEWVGAASLPSTCFR